ncbi:MAG: MmcQ/YjbR family DNA-binding protein [Clostridia bacterium]|nr:MmcQ/YjbR family DNA-binding protein [Clostridia bacterium]
MDKYKLEEYIADTYGVEADYPWQSTPEYAVYRHSDSRKWFAVVMDIPKRYLGLAEDGRIDIMNIKCPYATISTLLGEEGFYPAYHMNKYCWISVALDGRVGAETVKELLELSHSLTSNKK